MNRIVAQASTARSFSPLAEPAPPPPPPGAPPTGTKPKSTAAILGFVFSLLALVQGVFFQGIYGFYDVPALGFLGFGFLIAGLVLGFVGMSQTNPRTGTKSGRGFAIAAITIGFIVLGIALLFLLFILFIIWTCGRGASECRGSSSSSYQESGPGDSGCCTAVGNLDLATATPDPGLAAALPAVVACARTAPALTPALATMSMSGSREALYAHHPACDHYAEHVFTVRGLRFCVGCFTFFPVFLGTYLLGLVLPVAAAWTTWTLAGSLLLLFHLVSVLGWATRRSWKVVSKTGLGVGLAMLIHGIDASVWPEPIQKLALSALALVLLASTIPRTRRMERGCPHTHAAMALVA